MAEIKVIIIGAGLSGLSTAIALRKYCDPNSLDITIYEKPNRRFGHDKASEQQRQAELGAGVSLQSNGVRVLHDLRSELGQKVVSSGFPCNHFKWKTAGDFMLGRESVNALLISRSILIDCLAEHLPPSTFRYKIIAEVIAGPVQRPKVRFADGSPDESVDIVIEADGVGSTVRHSIFPNDKYKAEYLGYCAVGGILTDVRLPQDLLDEGHVKFFLGATGAFGYTGLSQADHNTILYFSIYDTDLPDRTGKIDSDLLLKELRERHSDWSDPMIAKCLSKAQVDNVYPIFVMPEMPYWGSNGCVLIGDAAHALPSASGQSSSQALEDGQTLGLLLAKYLKLYNTAAAVEKSIQALYSVRSKRVHRIRAWAMAWKDPKRPMSTMRTLALYIFLSVFIRLRWLASLFKSIDDWNVEAAVNKHIAHEQQYLVQ